MSDQSHLDALDAMATPIHSRRPGCPRPLVPFRQPRLPRLIRQPKLRMKLLWPPELTWRLRLPRARSVIQGAYSVRGG